MRVPGWGCDCAISRDSGAWFSTTGGVRAHPWCRLTGSRGRVAGAFATTAESDAAAGGTYKNQWWIPGDDHGSFYGVGIFGQYLWLDPQSDVVIAKFSATDQPVADTPAHLDALGAIARAAALTRQEA